MAHGEQASIDSRALAASADEAVAALAAPAGDGDLEAYLNGPVRGFISVPGKRIRPVMCGLGCAIVGGDPGLANTAAAAMEAFHSAALIHDDVEDGAAVRRGSRSLHVRYGVPLAVNAGDYLLVKAAGTIVSDETVPCDMRLAILAELVETALLTIEGQAVDIGWAADGRWDMTVEACLQVAEKKTAHYTCATPLVVGAMLGGGSPDQLATLRRAGIDAGVAFQLFDDLSNLTQGQDVAGKDFALDIVQGKRTAIVAHALANSGRSCELREILSAGAGGADVPRAIEIIEAAGSMDYVERLACERIDRAVLEIETGFGASPARESLLDLIRSMGEPRAA